MARFGAHVAEVVGRIDEAFAEVKLPDAIHDGAAQEEILFARQPLGKSGAARAFGFVNFKIGLQVGKAEESAGFNFADGLCHVAAAKEVDGARFGGGLKTS